MNFYERWILPPILDLIMRPKHLTKYRRTVRVDENVAPSCCAISHY
jgi:hypothetical protein